MATLTRADYTLFVDIPTSMPESKLTRHTEHALRFEVAPAINSKALMAAIKGDIPANSDLLAFFNEYVKPYWVYAAFCEFELRWGIDITQAGMKIHKDDFSDNISDRQRSDLLASDKSKRNLLRSDMLRELSDQKRTFDGQTFGKDILNEGEKQAGNNWRIHAVGSGNGKLSTGRYPIIHERAPFYGKPTGDYNHEDYN